MAEDVSQSKVTFPAVDVLVVSGRFVTKPSERIVAPSSVSLGLTLDMCMFRGPVVLREALDQFVFTEKSNELLKKISRQGFRGSSRALQPFRESDGLWLNSVRE